MKLWILSPKQDKNGNNPKAWKPWYDKCFAMLIRAETEQRARQIATENAADECSAYSGKKDAWLDPEQSKCEELTSDGKEELLIRDVSEA